MNKVSFNEDNYNKLCSNLSSISDSLSSINNPINVNFTSKLLSYYNNNCYQNGNDDLNEVIHKIEDLILKVSGSLDIYKKTDEELYFTLDSIINEIFGLDTNSEYSELSLNEKETYIDNMINQYEIAYNDMLKEYETLYGKGIPVEEEKFIGMFDIFYSLGIFDNNTFNLSNKNQYSIDEGGIYYHDENGNFYLNYGSLSNSVGER